MQFTLPIKNKGYAMTGVIKIARRLLATIVMLGIYGASSAMPVNPQVIQGSASFVKNGNQLTISATTLNTIIDWTNFTIDTNETVSFLQPSASSSILNRVISSDPLQIYGTLQSNGIVSLEGASFVLGDSGRIYVAGLNISTSPGPIVVNHDLPSGTGDITIHSSGNPSPAPLPAAPWLFISGMIGLFGVRYRRNS